jgi:hypothetical protein
MTDIRVILISDEKPTVADKNDIYSFLDESRELTGLVYAEAANSQKQHLEEYIQDIPAIPELLVKKVVSVSEINSAALMLPRTGYNYVLPVIPGLQSTVALQLQQAAYGGQQWRGRRKIPRPVKPTAAFTASGLAVIFNEPTLCSRDGARACIPAGEIADVTGIIVETSRAINPPYYSVAHKPLIAFRQFNGASIQVEDLVRLSHYLADTRHSAVAVFIDLHIARRPAQIPRIVIPDVTPAPYSPAMASLSFIRLFARDSDVYNSGLIRLLFLEKEYGLTDSRVQQIINAFISQHKVDEAQAARIAARVKKWCEETAIAKIIEDKFGTQRLKEIRSISRLKHISLIKALPAKEAAAVTAEKTARDNYLVARLDNKCAHIRALHAFEKARESSRGAALKDLLEYRDRHHKGDGFIMCGTCHFPLVCPHIETYYSIADSKPMEVRAAMEPFIAFRARNQFFCRICGEVIQSIEDFGDLLDSRPSFGSMDEDLRRKITAEAFSLLRYLSFSVVIIVKDLVYASVDAVYPLVQETERQISKSRVSSAEESSAKSKLFISIYIWAHFLDVILRNPIVSLKDFRVARGSKDYVVELVLAITKIITVNKNIVINQIKNVTAQIIKTKLIDAYRLLAAGSADYTVAVPRIEGFMATGGLYRVMALAQYLHTGNKIFKTEGVKATEAVLGKLTPGEDVFSHAPFVHLQATKYENGKLIKAAKDDIEPRIFIRAYEMIMGLTPYHLYDNIGTDGKIVMRHAETYAKLLRRKEEHEALNEPFHLARRIMGLPRYGGIKHSPRASFHSIPIGRIYDKDGQLHKWVLGKCTMCEETRAAAEKVDGQVILDAIRRNNRIHNLFLFFENKCPLAPLHTMKDGKCTTCGLGEMTRDQYYEKYSEAFDKEFSAASVAISLPVAEVPVQTEVVAPKWTYDFSKVLNFCEKTGINRWLVLSMGATEKVPMADILAGNYIAPEIFDKTHTRVFVLAAYIRTTFLFYEQIKNYYSIAGQSQEVMKFVTTYPISEDMVKSLAELPRDFTANLHGIIATKKPREIIEFLIEYFCVMSSKIWDMGALGQAIVKYNTARLFRADELASKHGTFNKALVFGETSASEAVLEVELATKRAADEEEDEDPFGMDNFDMEEDPDAIPDDDPENVVPVGDDSGMD